MPRVDFTELKKIPFVSVLHFYNVETRKRSNTELIANCPLPSHPSDSKHEWTLAISTEIGKAYCHNTRCREASNKPKGLDCIDFVCMMENLTPLEGGKKLKEMFCLNGVQSNVSVDTPTPPSKPLNPPLNFALKYLDPHHPYIKARGITLETAMEFGIGYQSGKGSMAGRICFPLHENGALIGYAGRTTLEVTPVNPKWLLPLGLHRTFLFGLERCEHGRELYLTESAWAVLWFFQHGIQAAALIGCSLTSEQELLLEPFAEIRICMDNDAAGHEAAAKIAERLKSKHKVSKAYINE